MRPDNQQLRDRTKQLAVRLLRLARSLPNSVDGQVIARQVLRSGTSAAANYRAACRARSKAEFVAKLSIVVEEMDETLFWLELISEARLVPANRLSDLVCEATELTKIFASARRTARGNAAD